MGKMTVKASHAPGEAEENHCKPQSGWPAAGYYQAEDRDITEWAMGAG